MSTVIMLCYYANGSWLTRICFVCYNLYYTLINNTDYITLHMLAYLMYNIKSTMGHNTILVHIAHVTCCFGFHCIFIH